jgi:acyl carrier protein
MDLNQILTELNTIFTDVLDNDDIQLNMQTTANDIDEWDSLNHIQLVVAIEKYFKLRFTSAEIQGWKNVGEICTMIQAKKNAA